MTQNSDPQNFHLPQPKFADSYTRNFSPLLPHFQNPQILNLFYGLYVVLTLFTKVYSRSTILISQLQRDVKI